MVQRRDLQGAERELAESFAAILDLQPQWQWQNTSAMERRGDLVRNRCPALLSEILSGFEAALRQEISVEGSDGAGRKARVPWVRLFDRARAPSATKGWYVVYLFCGDGSGMYLSLNQGTTDPQAGYRARNPDYLRDRVKWARENLVNQETRRDELLTRIDLRDAGHLATNYQAGNVLAIYYDRGSIPKRRTAE